MDSRVDLMSFVMVALLMKGAAAGIHSVNWTVPSNKSDYTTWANTTTFYLYDQLQFRWSGTHNVANATKDEYDNCLKTAKVLTSTSLITLIDLNTSGPHYFICTIDDHCESGQKLAINVTNVISPTLTTPPPPPSSASALAVGTLFAIVPENAHSRTIYVGTPVTSIQEPTKQNIFTCQRAENVSHRIPQVDVMDIQEKPREAEYDLSLRLGPVSHLCTDRSFASETEDIGSSNSQEGGKFNDYSPSISKEFCFFPTKTAYDPSESTSSMWNSEGEDRSLEPTLKKRKATFRNNEEDGQFFCQPPGQPNKFPGRFTGPGL